MLPIDLANQLAHRMREAGALLTSNNRAEVLTDGAEKFRTLLEALAGARHHIHIEYYIFKNDQIGTHIREILMRKRAEGVEIRVIVDGLGSRALSKAIQQEMSEQGIEIRHFSPLTLMHLFKVNARNHRKIVVVDGRVGFVGGMNIGDEYLSWNERIGYWRDTHLKLEGECVHELQRTFLQDWRLLTGQAVEGANYYPVPAPAGGALTQIVKTDPSCSGPSIRDLFSLSILTAQKRVYLETPYFAPCRRTLSALKQAAQRGLDVRLIVQGRTETPLTYWAARSYFADLLRSGVQIYMYQKGILHCKVLLADEWFASVGSANFDIRSFRWNLEINAAFYDRELAARLEQDFWEDVRHSRLIDAEFLRQRPYSHRFRERTARLFAPLL